jgi:hypothetical protein
MEMPEMMAAWLAETDRIRAKGEPPTLTEEFFIGLTLEFDWARNHHPDNVRYLEFLLQAVEMYLIGRPDEAMTKVLCCGRRNAGM